MLMACSRDNSSGTVFQESRPAVSCEDLDIISIDKYLRTKHQKASMVVVVARQKLRGS